MILALDHHTLAIISIAGSSLDVLGALYLAYDLLGGEHGPLRALTRGVTYGLIFAVGYGIPLGPVFAIACGVTHGFTLAWEFSLASRGTQKPGFWYDATASTIRGMGHGIGAAWYFGPLYGIVFGAASAVAQIAAYRIGIRPTLDYSSAPRPRFTRRHVLAAVNRAVGYGLVAAWLCVQLAHQPGRALPFGLRIGLTMGLVTLVSSGCTPVIEWAADHIPEKRMGVVGVGLILVGFSLQSVQYWITVLDIPVQ
ncbi:MAG TPA: hypothetical protein VMR62_19550 [Bryobacteraceae bacterium]|jgi:hypothetical protein|nr:hypothetical protein [Bryobacteraceae bacterium]